MQPYDFSHAEKCLAQRRVLRSIGIKSVPFRKTVVCHGTLVTRKALMVFELSNVDLPCVLKRRTTDINFPLIFDFLSVLFRLSTDVRIGHL